MRLMLTVLVALLLASIGGPYAPARTETIRVIQLHGPDVDVPIEDAHKISALGWAMILERDICKPEEKRTLDLFDLACKRRPGLLHEVARLQVIRDSIEGMRRQRIGYRTITRYVEIKP